MYSHNPHSAVTSSHSFLTRGTNLLGINIITCGDIPLCLVDIFLLDVRSLVVVLEVAAEVEAAANCWGGANELMLPIDVPTLPIVD